MTADLAEQPEIVGRKRQLDLIQKTVETENARLGAETKISHNRETVLFIFLIY